MKIADAKPKFKYRLPDWNNKEYYIITDDVNERFYDSDVDKYSFSLDELRTEEWIEIEDFEHCLKEAIRLLKKIQNLQVLINKNINQLDLYNGVKLFLDNHRDCA